MQRKIIKIGDDLGIILPKHMLAHMKASVGDTLVATDTQDGVKLALAGPNFDHQMATAREVMAKRKQALKAMK